jgi:putative membrane protein
MDTRIRSTVRTFAAFGAVALITVACRKNDEYAAARNESAAGRVVTPADTTTKPVTSSNGWTEESILAYLRQANIDEIATNKLAAKKATASSVKQFARKMEADHQAGLKEVDAMIGNANLPKDSTKLSADTLHSEANDVVKKHRDEVKDLTDKKAGADWDKDYINMQIDEHKEVLDKLSDAAKNTTNKDLQALLVKMTGAVQEHLTKAEAIKAQLK